MSVAFISHADCGRHDTGWGHPEHVGRLRAVTRALRDRPELFGAIEHHEGRHATAQEIALAHDPIYIRQVESLVASGGGALDADTVASEGSWAAAIAAVGCLLDGVDMALDGRATHSFSAVRPPGHHALRDRAMGFCVFANVAIAAHYARRRHNLDRVLIVDWDVHHGNGTQALIEPDPGIHFVSMHQWPWYPGSGASDDHGNGNVWNVPLPAGLPAQRYVDELEHAIDQATEGFTPDLVLISAGFDSLRGDPLGGFTLELDDVSALTHFLTDRADQWCGGRVVSALEGGYAPDRVAEGVVTMLAVLAR